MGSTQTQRVLLAVRLSHLTDESTSPDRQKTVTRDHAERQGLARNRHGRRPGRVGVHCAAVRPAEARAMAGRTACHAWDALVFWRADRAVRSMADMFALTRWTQQHRKVIVFVSGRFGCDPLTLDMRHDRTDPHVNLILAIIAFAAEVDSQAIKERVNAARAYLIALSNHTPAAEKLWTILARTSPPPTRAEPAAQLAICAYLRGEGTLAGLATDAADPHYSPAGTVRQIMDIGLPPHKFRTLLTDSFNGCPFRSGVTRRYPLNGHLQHCLRQSRPHAPDVECWRLPMTLVSGVSSGLSHPGCRGTHDAGRVSAGPDAGSRAACTNLVVSARRRDQRPYAWRTALAGRVSAMSAGGHSVCRRRVHRPCGM